MKKFLLFFFISIFSVVSVMAEDTDESFWYNEFDDDGVLRTLYFTKTEAQLSNNFNDFVYKSTGLNSYPNLQKMKSKMVSDEYLKNQYPEIGNLIATQELNKIMDGTDFLYTFYAYESIGIPIILLIKYKNNNCYLSYAYFNQEDYKWMYLDDFLNLLTEFINSFED